MRLLKRWGLLSAYLVKNIERVKFNLSLKEQRDKLTEKTPLPDSTM